MRNVKRDILVRSIRNAVIRKRITDDLRKLEARVAELEEVNRELEMFNYMVAHDLRKPLTVVNGYCQALQEFCGDQLDAECREYLREAYSGTWRMDRLIEALLQFSGFGQHEMSVERVDLSGIAAEVAVELELAEPERQVEFRIEEGLIAHADAALLRVALEKLLGNAWKYTGFRDNGIIEFGSVELQERVAYFVRDNGAGFDMADVKKIFLPFQRLPGAESLRGHGIGLASVAKIIRRHGGEVWAEGEPGKGATFYFTLSGEKGEHSENPDSRR